MTADEYINVLVSEGYTEREARFLNLAAEHSGFFTIAQYRGFLDLKAGKTSQRLIDRVREFKHAVVVGRINRKSEVLQLTDALCEAVETPAPRPKEASVRLQVLDFVIEHQDLDYLPREIDKVEYFTGLGVGKAKLSRINGHFFDERMPIYRVTGGAGFVWVDSGSLDDCDSFGSLATFDSFLQRYAALFAALDKAVVTFATAGGNGKMNGGAKRFEATMRRLAKRQKDLLDLKSRPVSSLGGPELRLLKRLMDSVAESSNRASTEFHRFALKHKYRLTV